MHLTVSSFFVLLQIKLERMILTCIAKLWLQQSICCILRSHG
jgi:hypothetical protein